MSTETIQSTQSANEWPAADQKQSADQATRDKVSELAAIIPEASKQTLPAATARPAFESSVEALRRAALEEQVRTSSPHGSARKKTSPVLGSIAEFAKRGALSKETDELAPWSPKALKTIPKHLRSGHPGKSPLQTTRHAKITMESEVEVESQ
jgi:hypothetical protein